MKKPLDDYVIIAVYLCGLVWMILFCFFHVNILLCPTKMVFGIPCPGCGTTRAMGLLLNGNIKEAFFMNPNIIITLIMMIIVPPLLVMQFTTNKNYIDLINRKLNNPFFIVPFFLFEIIIWIYNLQRAI